MKGFICRVLETLFAALMVGCVLFGLILMLCENVDFHKQIASMITGLILICIGFIPGVVTSLIAKRKEERNGSFYG